MPTSTAQIPPTKKKSTTEVGIPGRPNIAPTAVPTYQTPQIAGPSAGLDLTKLTPALKGQLRSQADVAGNQQVAQIAKASGGRTGSAQFQLLSTIAKTGAAAQAGAAGANLDFQAADAMRADELQRQTFNAGAAQQANQLALQATLGIGGLNQNAQDSADQYQLGKGALDLNRQNSASNNRLQLAQILNSLNAGANGFSPTVGGGAAYNLLKPQIGAY